MTIAQAIRVKEVAFTAYPVLDMDRARRFYEGILGLTPTSITEGQDGNHWVEYALDGTYFTLGHMPQFIPNRSGAVAAFEVADLDASVDELRKHGVKFLLEPLETPVCRMCMFEDSEGNALMFHQLKS